MSKINQAGDRIAYLVVTAPGGQDGMDASDKGGVVVLATFDKAEAISRKGKDSRLLISPKIVATEDTTRAFAKLDKLEALLVERYYLERFHDDRD